VLILDVVNRHLSRDRRTGPEIVKQFIEKIYLLELFTTAMDSNGFCLFVYLVLFCCVSVSASPMPLTRSKGEIYNSGSCGTFSKTFQSGEQKKSS
jgi:formate hydrogenlyase subunit 4